MSKFVQIIEFKTTRIDEFTRLLDAWLVETEGSRAPSRGTLTRDRDQGGTYVQIVEFPSYEQAMENSDRAETAAFAKSMAELCDGPAVFRNLDVLREEKM